MDYCQGGSLASKIRGSPPPPEFEVLSWIVEISMALRTMHENGLTHKHLTLENVLLTEYGTVRLGESGKIYESSKPTQPTSQSDRLEKVKFLAPEVFTDGMYDAKSDIWSMGCILYELCTQHSAFSAESPIKLITKITEGPNPSLPEHFSPELCELLSDIFNIDLQSRPTASEILERPIMISCLSEKSKRAVKDLQTKLDNLRQVADSLERVHQVTTIGSLAGGVIGAAGGITSIVGLILAPFTLGALIVTGVGIGVSVAGGLTAGASNITNMVNQSSDRKAVRSIIKEFEERINAVVTWLQEITNSLEAIQGKCDSADTLDTEGNQFNKDNLARLGSRAGRGLGGIAELIRLVQVMNIGRIAAQTSRAVRVAEVATGVLSGLFLAVDIFFIAMDAKELHHIRKAKAVEERANEREEEEEPSDSESMTEHSDFASTSDQDALVANSPKQEVTPQPQNQGSQNDTEIRSEIMKFVRSIRQAADELQSVLDELKKITSSIPSLHSESELEWIE
ncbi:serine/threonine-protein kinase PLK4-like isoform X2 [Sparus aurata]|nr:serine/threonine-protein kinase PLK4-like isoform X2 [Sparus aurata]XP_030252189.1 serine/threonine-protein kinase PLK4-like isoform X2 [Sparus aurata]